MLYHISCEKGTLAGVHRLFHVVQDKYDASHRILYINNTTSGTLAQALRESSAAWVNDPHRTMQFEYERVSSIFEVVDKLQASKHDVVVVERLDAIMQENTREDYAHQNRALASLMGSDRDLVFIDTWSYLDTYYIRTPL
ncbi:hypothetical protein OXX69_002098 [Metschnikowia pulcherrima]